MRARDFVSFGLWHLWVRKTTVKWCRLCVCVCVVCSWLDSRYTTILIERLDRVENVRINALKYGSHSRRAHSLIRWFVGVPTHPNNCLISKTIFTWLHWSAAPTVDGGDDGICSMLNPFACTLRCAAIKTKIYCTIAAVARSHQSKSQQCAQWRSTVCSSTRLRALNYLLSLEIWLQLIKKAWFLRVCFLFDASNVCINRAIAKRQMMHFVARSPSVHDVDTFAISISTANCVRECR